MSTAELHPAYLEAAPEHRWRGDTLKRLFEYLDTTSLRSSPSWSGVILPHGARVAMRQLPGKPRELLIYRREKYATQDGPAKWSSEIITFAREFGCLSWAKEHGITAEGGPKVVFTETSRPIDFFNGE